MQALGFRGVVFLLWGFRVQGGPGLASGFFSDVDLR